MSQTIEQLAAQRRRYALALGAAVTDRARVRHLRNMEQLENEIAAHVDALAATAPARDVAPTPPPQTAMLLDDASAVVSGVRARNELSDRTLLARVLAVAFGVGFLAVALAMALAAR